MSAKEEELMKQCHALEEKFNAVSEELEKFKKAEEEQKMMSMLENFAHCFSAERYEEIKGTISNITFAELETEINSGIKDFALKMKTTKEEPIVEEVKVENTLQFSVSPFVATISTSSTYIMMI